MASSEEQMKMTPNKKVGNIDNAENNDSIVERANHSDDGVAALIPSMETMSTREREEITQNENVEQKHKKNDQIDTTRMEELENMFSEILTQIQQLKSPSELEKITRQTAADLYAKAKDCKLLLDDVITKVDELIGVWDIQGNSSFSHPFVI
uniref:Uncharacterized protein n=1 Tax=Plectus sambesii TaxID=2011161 RepID=A0A914WIQ6_9BILA